MDTGEEAALVFQNVSALQAMRRQPHAHAGPLVWLWRLSPFNVALCVGHMPAPPRRVWMWRPVFQALVWVCGLSYRVEPRKRIVLHHGQRPMFVPTASGRTPPRTVPIAFKRVPTCATTFGHVSVASCELLGQLEALIIAWAGHGQDRLSASLSNSINE